MIKNNFFKKNLSFLTLFLLLDYIYIYNNIIIYIYILLLIINIYCIFFEKKYNYIYILFLKKNLFLIKIFFLLKYVYSFYFFKKNIFLSILGNNNLFFLKNKINITLYIDNYSINYILLTSILTYIILIYSYNYMKYDVHINSFCILINFFSISMITLLLAGNFITLVLG
jgi:NADH:ubiquinone oxidoreductase subunit 5 (subunit L)/multisubunit Na+/H+ antiporter MnhA subunit